MSKKIKKGFTIVELVIVIAIIGVLSAILIPTFTGLLNSARESADIQMVKNLNTALASDTAINGKHETIYDAIKVANETGYSVEKLTPTASGCDIVWDITTDRFVIMSGNELKFYDESTTPSKNKADLWKIYKEVPAVEEQTYSIYLTGSEETKAVEINGVGFDAGENSNISKVNYVNNETKNVTIRTNGGDLVVNAPNDTVTHYGTADSVEIIAVASNSYHEYGIISKIQLVSGRLVAENSAEISSIVIDDNAVADSISIVIEQNALVKSIIAKDESLIQNVDDKSNKTTVSSYTVVSTFEELKSNITDGAYLLFANDISYPTNGQDLININVSCTIDGNGHTLSGYGYRTSSSKPTIAINLNGSNMVDVVIKNLTITSDLNVGRAIETRGNINSLTIDNCVLNVTGSGNNQVLTIGGNQSSSANIIINNSTLSAGNGGYPIISFNPMNLSIDNSTISGYCGIFFKGVDGSEGSHGSVVTCTSTNFECPNVHSLGSNDFGVFALQDENITINLIDCGINASQIGTALQAVILESSYAKRTGGCSLNISDNCVINGTLVDSYWETSLITNVNITGGTFSVDPSNVQINGDTYNLVAEGYKVIRESIMYKVVKA